MKKKKGKKKKGWLGGFGVAEPLLGHPMAKKKKLWVLAHGEGLGVVQPPPRAKPSNKDLEGLLMGSHPHGPKPIIFYLFFKFFFLNYIIIYF
jgi:hypothetical protein